MVGIFAYLFLEGRPIAALSVFVLAFLTDILDGYLARRNNWISNIGKLLDPFADKLLTVVALVCICIGKRQAAFIWLCALTAAKELLMVFGGMFLLRRRVVVYADWFGKIATRRIRRWHHTCHALVPLSADVAVGPVRARPCDRAVVSGADPLRAALVLPAPVP